MKRKKISNRLHDMGLILRGSVALACVFFTGCKKIIDVPPPNSQLVTPTVFNNSATATAAQVAIYEKMVTGSESFNMSQYSGLLADELTSYSTVPTETQLYTNAMLAINNNFGPWINGYNYIYQANAIIAALQNNQNINPAIKQQLTGESKFVRAFWHFYLTNVYGDVPLVLTTDYTVNDKIARTPQTQVYNQVVSDLNDAVQSLSSNYVDATDTAVTTERTRPTKWAAYAMLARTYLYMGKYALAEAAATSVINNTRYYQLCQNLSPTMGSNSVFLANSSEAIWQLAIPLPNINDTPDALGYVLTGRPGTATGKSTTISHELLSSFEPGDLRKTYWVGTVTTGNPSTPYFFPYKYQNISSNITEYVMVLRLAEQYLIRAEAEAQLNDLTDAVNDLNVIRNRAGLPNTTDASQSDILNAILHERQIELFSEWGHRWFDLIRTNSINAVMGGASGVSALKGGSWVSTDKLYPIPSKEIGNDPNLSQNLGY